MCDVRCVMCAVGSLTYDLIAADPLALSNYTTGAVVGAYTFGYLGEITSLYFVFCCSAGLAICGVVLTYACLPAQGFRPSVAAKGADAATGAEESASASASASARLVAGAVRKRNQV